MLRFELVSYLNGIKLFNYYPSGDGAKGVIAVCDDGDRYIVEESKDDVKGMYAQQALWSDRINKVDSGMIAWC